MWKDNTVKSVWLEVATDKKPTKFCHPIQLLTQLEISHKDLQIGDYKIIAVLFIVI